MATCGTLYTVPPFDCFAGNQPQQTLGIADSKASASEPDVGRETIMS